MAEVAAAFMGFSMVVGLLRADSPSGRARFLMVRDVAEIGLLTVAASLLPLVLHHYGATEAWIWRISSAVVSAVWIVSLTLAIRRVGVSNPRAPWRQSRASLIAGLIINVAGNALLWWNVLKPPDVAGALYVSALSLLLVLAGGMFVQATFQERPAG